MNCKNCGAFNSTDSKVCFNCGTVLENVNNTLNTPNVNNLNNQVEVLDQNSNINFSSSDSVVSNNDDAVLVNPVINDSQNVFSSILDANPSVETITNNNVLSNSQSTVNETTISQSNVNESMGSQSVGEVSFNNLGINSQPSINETTVSQSNINGNIGNQNIDVISDNSVGVNVQPFVDNTDSSSVETLTTNSVETLDQADADNTNVGPTELVNNNSSVASVEKNKFSISNDIIKVIIIVVLILLLLLALMSFVFGRKNKNSLDTSGIVNNNANNNSVINSNDSDNSNSSSSSSNSKCILNSTITKDHTPVSFSLSYNIGDVITIGGIDYTVYDTNEEGLELVSAYNENMSSFIYPDMLDYFSVDGKLDIRVNSQCKNWYFNADADNFSSNVDTNFTNYTGSIYKTDRSSELDQALTVSAALRGFSVSEVYYADDAVSIGSVLLKRDSKGYFWFEDETIFSKTNFNTASLVMKKDSTGFIYADVTVTYRAAAQGYTLQVKNTVDAEGYSYINSDGYSSTFDGEISFISLN